MTKMILRALCFCAFILSANLTAASVAKIGDFKIDQLLSHHRLLLDDGNVYKPRNSHRLNVISSWQLGDNILVLQDGSGNKFILVNTARNQQVKVKVVSFSSS